MWTLKRGKPSQVSPRISSSANAAANLRSNHSWDTKRSLEIATSFQCMEKFCDPTLGIRLHRSRILRLNSLYCTWTKVHKRKKKQKKHKKTARICTAVPEAKRRLKRLALQPWRKKKTRMQKYCRLSGRVFDGDKLNAKHISVASFHHDVSFFSIFFSLQHHWRQCQAIHCSQNRARVPPPPFFFAPRAFTLNTKSVNKFGDLHNNPNQCC